MIIWMLWSVVFAALIGLAAAALDRIAGHFAAPRRYIWIAALVACAVVPAVLATRRVAPAAAPAPLARPKSGESIATDPAARQVPSPIARTVRRAAVANASADTWATRVWIVLSLVVLTAFVRGARSLHRRRATWGEAQLDRHCVLVAPDAGPAVIGFTRPRIVLPEWALTLDTRTQDLMLRHEIEHVRAHDPQALLTAGALLVVAPWNAVLWWIVRRLRLAMELDCDTRVIRAIGGSHDYGMVLLAVGERHTTSLPLAASLAWPRPLLERRIKAMTTPRPRRPLVASLPLVAVALLTMTAAARTPHPASLSAIAQARGPQPYPTREAIASMIAENVPALGSGADTANYVVLVLDANNNFVRAIPGVGSCMISVAGDTLTPQQRNSRTIERTGAGLGGRGGAGGAGRGGSGAGARSGGSAGTPPAAPLVAQFRQSTSRQTAPSTYVAGEISGHTDPVTGARVTSPMNAAAGLNSEYGKGKEGSGIDGIAASQLTSLDTFMFAGGQIAPRTVRVVVVTTNTLGPVK
jgi:beta-lactamase regulating signal transducer with metallopeptidase domain